MVDALVAGLCGIVPWDYLGSRNHDYDSGFRVQGYEIRGEPSI